MHPETRLIDAGGFGGGRLPGGAVFAAGSSSSAANSEGLRAGSGGAGAGGLAGGANGGTERVVCRFGVRCTRAACPFDHPGGRLIDGTAQGDAWGGDGAQLQSLEVTIAAKEKELQAVEQKENGGPKEELTATLEGLLGACVEAGKADKAFELVRRLRQLEASISDVKLYASLVQLLCLHDADISRAWEVFLDMRKHWSQASVERDATATTPSAAAIAAASSGQQLSFSAFNRPYQVAFDAMLAKIGPPTAMPALLPRTRAVCDKEELVGRHPALSIMSFNILADGFSREFSYQFVCLESFDFLRWESRLPLILGEILRAGADIVCLQEVDSRHFPEIQRAMCHRGYAGVFSPRTSRDGVAVFFLASSFRTVHWETVASAGGCVIVLESLTLHQGASVQQPNNAAAENGTDEEGDVERRNATTENTGEDSGNGDNATKNSNHPDSHNENSSNNSTSSSAAGIPWGVIVANAHFSYTHGEEQPKALLDAVARAAAGRPGFARVCCGDFNGLSTVESEFFESAGFGNSYAASSKSMASGRPTRCTSHTTVDRRGGELDFIWASRGLQPVSVIQVPDDQV